MKNLLVIDFSSHYDWRAAFKGAVIPSTKETLHIDVCGWQDISLVASSLDGVKLQLKKSENPMYSSQREDREFSPDFLLVRNFPQNLHGLDYKNVLLGLMFANIPSVNSLQSIYMCSEKPIVYGALKSIQKKIKDFPVIDQYYYANIPTSNPFHEASITPKTFPVIAKIATIHAGYGKMKLDSQPQLEDFCSCVMLGRNYYTLEPFVKDCIYDYRLQKIGNHYRVYTRSSKSGWRNNWGDMSFESVNVSDKFRSWMDEVASLFGGIDMFALDVMHTKDGKDYIIELNDTAMGLNFESEKEDVQNMRELVLNRMDEVFGITKG